MTSDADEPMLPYTPSNTGRRARVGYLGFEGVGFNDLCPLFAGLVLSISLALRYFVGEGGPSTHWLARTVAAALPLTGGVGYLKLAVVGRPPHFKGDLWATALGLRVDFSDPPLRHVPFWPSLGFDNSADSGPGRAADLPHPLAGRRPARGEA